MYTLVRRSSVRALVTIQGPTLVVSLVIAEIFFKFHSFTLECLAFLSTWVVLDWMISAFIDGRKPSNDSRR